MNESKFKKALREAKAKMSKDLKRLGRIPNEERVIDPFDKSLSLNVKFEKDKAIIYRYKDIYKFESSWENRLWGHGYIGTVEAMLFEFNHLSKDHKYLRRVYTMIKASARSHEEAIMIIKTIKNKRYWSMVKTWEDVLSTDIVNWAWFKFGKLTVDKDCVDNFRVANMGKSSQMRRYKRQRDKGCCGSFESVEIGPDGDRYLLGFNHGH
jgi:hypothetical protein